MIGHGPRVSREELGDGRVRYKYADGTTSTVQLKPKKQRRKYEPKGPPLPDLLPDTERVMPVTRPFRDLRRHYKGQHLSR